MRRIFSIVLIVIILLSMMGCSSRKNLNNYFNDFKIETSQPIPYVCYDTLTFGNKKIDFSEVLKTNKIQGIFNEVYVIKDNTIWFGYSNIDKNENGSQTWNVASIVIDSDQLNLIYSGEFCMDNKADKTYTQNNNKNSGNLYVTDNGYYYDGKIVLTDKVKVVEIDMTTMESQEFLSTDYQHPTLSVEAEIIDHQNILFHKDSIQRTFDIKTGEQSSKGFKKLCQLEKKKNWQGKSYLSELFDKVQIVDEKVYIICRIINWDGETHAVVFQYDFDNHICYYAFHCFMDDVISNHLYVVPTI